MCDLSPVRKKLYGDFMNVRERADLKDERLPRNISFGAKSGPPPISPEKRVRHGSYVNWPNALRNLYQSQFVISNQFHSPQKKYEINIDEYKKYFLKLKRPLNFTVWKDKVYADIDNSKRLGPQEKTQYRSAVESLCDEDLKKVYQVLKKEYEQLQRDQRLVRNKQSSADIRYQTEKYSDGFSNHVSHKQSKGKDMYGFGKCSNWDTASPSREHLLAERLDHSITERNRGRSPVFKMLLK